MCWLSYDLTPEVAGSYTSALACHSQLVAFHVLVLKCFAVQHPFALAYFCQKGITYKRKWSSYPLFKKNNLPYSLWDTCCIHEERFSCSSEDMVCHGYPDFIYPCICCSDLFSDMCYVSRQHSILKWKHEYTWTIVQCEVESHGVSTQLQKCSLQIWLSSCFSVLPLAGFVACSIALRGAVMQHRGENNI